MTLPPLENTGAPAKVLSHVRTWAELTTADRLEIYRNGQPLASGYLDQMTADAKTVWLIQDHGLGRILFHADDNVDLFHDRTPRPTALLTDDPARTDPASAPGRGQRGPALR